MKLPMRKLMSLVTRVLSQVGQRAKMPQNPSLGFFSDDKQVCIGFYLDSYSLGGILCKTAVAVRSIRGLV
jgi:hypothetical protein